MSKRQGVNPKDLIGSKKPSIGLVPATAIIGIATCMEDGAVKYGPYNWREKEYPVLYTTYINAAMRHILSYLDGEDCATDSGKEHIAHAMASLAILYDAIACDNAVDDRPIRGKAAGLIEWFSK